MIISFILLLFLNLDSSKSINHLSELKWKNRVLVVVTNEKEEIKDLITNYNNELNEREFLVIQLDGEKAFIDGVRYLGNRNLSFDAWMYFDQLHELHNLAKKVPNTPIVINHMGAPLKLGRWQKKQTEMHGIWKSELRKLAEVENVYLKIGGIGMENYFGTNWVSRAFPPSSDEVVTVWNERILWCIETFGTERCMFESNYPVDRQTLPYSVIWNTFQKITQPFTTSEKNDLFWVTAQSVYGVGS